MAGLFLIVLRTFSGIQFNSFKRLVTVPGSRVTVFNEACSSSLYSLYLFDIFFKCGSPRGVLGISSDGDDRRIFWGLKFSIPGFFLGTKIWLG